MSEYAHLPHPSAGLESASLFAHCTNLRIVLNPDPLKGVLGLRLIWWWVVWLKLFTSEALLSISRSLLGWYRSLLQHCWLASSAIWKDYLQISLLQDQPGVRCRNRTMTNDVCPSGLLENPESEFEITQNVSRTATHYSSSVSYRRTILSPDLMWCVY